ncbi:hypothetical protein H4R35_005387 [Dimargaris xerosporica]|nr:hypothetical protein H4R35_005387 [Dimargaris xerosporica]
MAAALPAVTSSAVLPLNPSQQAGYDSYQQPNVISSNNNVQNQGQANHATSADTSPNTLSNITSMIYSTFVQGAMLDAINVAPYVQRPAELKYIDVEATKQPFATLDISTFAYQHSLAYFFRKGEYSAVVNVRNAMLDLLESQVRTAFDLTPLVELLSQRALHERSPMVQVYDQAMAAMLEYTQVQLPSYLAQTAMAARDMDAMQSLMALKMPSREAQADWGLFLVLVTLYSRAPDARLALINIGQLLDPTTLGQIASCLQSQEYYSSIPISWKLLKTPADPSVCYDVTSGLNYLDSLRDSSLFTAILKFKGEPPF